jgi:hypothetical protein
MPIPPRHENVAANNLSRLGIEEVSRPVEEISTILDTAVETNIKLPMHGILNLS